MMGDEVEMFSEGMALYKPANSMEEAFRLAGQGLRILEKAGIRAEARVGRSPDGDDGAIGGWGVLLVDPDLVDAGWIEAIEDAKKGRSRHARRPT